jgi:hypothetical protein
VHRQAELLEVVLALDAAGRFARGLHRRQEQGHENADDGDHHEQLHEREAGAKLSGAAMHGMVLANEWERLRRRQRR